jgi:tetratricopeptide (TPR) repeat protein
MSEILITRSEELRQAALAQVRAGEYEAALSIYDEALAVAEDDETRELITINKADAMIFIQRSGPEVQALASIVMRRRTPRHVYLAAYALVFKYRVENELKRATFYGQLALTCAQEADEALWKIGALNELGVIYELDSKFDSAIDCFENALSIIESVHDSAAQSFSRVALISNLGYSKIMAGATVQGIALMESVLDQIQDQSARSDAYVELCYGYTDLNEFERARELGEHGLELAVEARQTRNAHYLLGDVAYKMGDLEAAEFHFDELARYYPDFRNLKHLLIGIDLRSMINLRL